MGYTVGSTVSISALFYLDFLDGCDIGLALGRSPDRCGKVRIPFKAGHDVPMQMRNGVSQGCKIDLGGAQVSAQTLFNLCDGLDAQHPVGLRQVGSCNFKI